MQFDGIGVVQFDDAGNKVKWHPAEKCGDSDAVSSSKATREDELFWWAYQNQQPVLISSVDIDRRFPATLEHLKRFGIQSGSVFPLTTAHRRLGCLFIGSEHPNSRCEEEANFLSLIAS